MPWAGMEGCDDQSSDSRSVLELEMQDDSRGFWPSGEVDGGAAKMGGLSRSRGSL